MKHCEAARRALFAEAFANGGKNRIRAAQAA
jgi:hypothetical protein